MSTFRHLDNLLDGKTSDELAQEVAARERRQAEEDQREAGEPPEQQEGRRPARAKSRRALRSAPDSSPDLRPLVTRTSEGATQGIYGLVLALSVIAVAWYSGPPSAGWVGVSVLATAVVFCLAHVYAYVLGRDMSQEQRLTRAEVFHSLRDNWSLVEVVIPVLLVLGLGEIGVLTNTVAIVAATVVAGVELAAASGYAAARHGARPLTVIASAAGGLTLGLIVVLLKALAYSH